MKIIDNCVLLYAGDADNHSLLIHTLNGTINVLSCKETEYVNKWIEATEIQIEDEKEQAFYLQLQKSEYLIDSAKSEMTLVNSLLEKCRNLHNSKDETASAVFVLTYQCNFSCPYCYEDSSKNDVGKIMTKDMVDKIFKLNNNDLKRITFYGGEPFLPQTMSIVKYIISKAPNAMYSATTNGYHLIDFFEILSNLRISNIMVTLDGPKEYHNKTRILKNGGETYDQVTHGIDKFLNNKIPVKIRMNISRDNLKQCMALREEYIHKFKSQYDAGILMFELQPIFQINPETKAELDEAIFYEKVSPNGAPSKYNMMSVTVSPVLNAFINNSKKHFRPRYCHCNAEWKSRFYDAEGNIYSCILALKNTAAAVGTYYPDFFLKQKSMLSRNIESKAQCRECKLKFLCGGGCANAIIDKNGDVMKPNCDMIVNEVYNELPKLFRRYIGTKELPNK